MQIDHIGVPARDAGASARRLATILGGPEPSIDGEDGDMFRVEVGQGAFLLFAPAPHVHPMHVAFRVDRERFDAIVGRLVQARVPFGNEPHDLENGQTVDALGQLRVYFLDPDEHLFEVTC